MASKYLDYDGLLYFWSKIKAAFVAKESGKGLSTNDYTTSEKDKLAGIESGAEVNDLTQVTLNGVNLRTGTSKTAQFIIKKNGSNLTVTNGAVDVTVPTKTSDLANDSNFVEDASYVHTDNNYTTAEKAKLGDIASGAQENVIETVKRNGTALAVTSKAVDISVPTKTSDLTNDSNFVEDASYVHTDNNFTDSLKSKLNNIEAQAERNDIVSVAVNGTVQQVVNRVVDISVPTKTSDLTNDSNFVEDASYVHTDNNFTSLLKNKLNGIAAGATVDDHNWNNVSLSKTEFQAQNNTVYVPMSTGLSAIVASYKAATNTPGSAYAIAMYDGNGRLASLNPPATSNSTIVATTSWVNTKISDAISGITGISFQIVASLPETGTTGVIYLISHSHGTGDIYDEYIWLAGEGGASGSYEKIGNTDIDLSGYWATADLVAITNSEIDTIVAS